jgi:hypothetical protein
MNCLEKWKQEYGDKREPDMHPALDEMCPSDFKYAPDPVDEFGRPTCSQMTCKQCWEREVEKVVAEMLETPDIPEEVIDKFNAIPLINTVPAAEIPKILDSGDRTKFESGAVRDMRSGKGRCDLMPLEVLSVYIGDDGFDPILSAIAEFQCTNDTAHLYNALAYFDAKHWDNCYTMVLETAKHYEEGANKYGPDNWRKSIPTWCYIDSAIRHYIKWLRGDKDEPHDRAFCWNLLCCIWEVDHGEEWRRVRDAKKLDV